MTASRACLGPCRLVLSALLTAVITVGATAASAKENCSAARIDIRGADTNSALRQSFAVELADTTESRAQGLMHRKALAPDAGMLFIYEAPRRAEFWMKDTLIPLDMIFADDQGLVTKVHANAVPGDLTPIYGGENIRYVLEINGGLAQRAGIVAGSQLRHPLIGADALWPCD